MTTPGTSVAARPSSSGSRAGHGHYPAHSASELRRIAVHRWATDPFVISYSQPFPLFEINDDSSSHTQM
jgi:hypothetical protein